jgi:hypothetical protein
MYRIRLASGEQAVFRTIDELALAMQSGVVGPTAEVYHQEENRWLPVESHPDYQAALAVTPAPEAEPEAPPAPPEGASEQRISTTTLSPLPLAAQPAPRPSVSTPPPALVETASEATAPSDPESPAPEPTPPPPPVALPPNVFATRARKLREMLALRLSLLLVIGVSATLVAYLAGHNHWRHDTTPEQHEGMSPMPVESIRPQAPVADLGVAPSRVEPESAAAELAEAADSASEPSVSAPVGAAAPRLDPYLAGYDDARDELDDALGYIRFAHLFRRARMSSVDSLRATLRTIAAARNVIQTYRAREVTLEQTVGATRPSALSLKESYEAGVATQDMLEDADSLYSLLSSQWGRYSLRADSVSFTNPTAAAIWTRVRNRLVSTTNTWKDSASSSSRVTLPRLINGLTNPTPPVSSQ